EREEEGKRRGDGCPADQIADRERQVPGKRRRRHDRNLGQRPGDREQDQAPERLAQPEAPVERVRRLREEQTGSPRRPRACNEDEYQERGGQAPHATTLR